MSDASLHELLSAWLDGRLTGSEKARAEKLISDDPTCADLVRQWKSQRNQMRALPRYRLDQDFAERVLAKANLAADPIRVSRPQAAAGSQLSAPESTSYFATRSALTAITALAAMLLLTLFTLPTRMPNNEVTYNTPSDKAVTVGPELDELDQSEIVAATDEEARDSQLIRMKAGDPDAVSSDSGNESAPKELAAAESLAELDDGLEPMKGGGRARAAGEISREPRQSPGALEEERPLVANSKSAAANADDSLQKQEDVELAMRQRADLQPKSDQNLEATKMELGGQLTKDPLPAEPAAEMAAKGLDAPDPESLERDMDEGQLAKDGAVRRLSPALQLAANSVDEIWTVMIEEEASLEKFEQVMRDNEIAFQTSPEGFGQQLGGVPLGKFDANVQAFHVITSPSQLRGAITMLSRKAEINVFPLPSSPSTDQAPEFARLQDPPNQPVDRDRSGRILGESGSRFGYQRSLAQQLPSFRFNSSFDPVEKLQTLNSGKAGVEAGKKVVSESLEGADNKTVRNSIPAIPAAPERTTRDQQFRAQSQLQPNAGQADAAQRGAGLAPAGQTTNQKGIAEPRPWYAEQKQQDARAAQQLTDKSAAAFSEAETVAAEPVAANLGFGTQLGEQEKLQRYLLVIRFDPATPPVVEAAPADSGK